MPSTTENRWQNLSEGIQSINSILALRRMILSCLVPSEELYYLGPNSLDTTMCHGR